MRIRGIHYDIGHRYEGRGPGSTRLRFERDAVAADMAMIAGRLHANAIRIAGTELPRLRIAAELALETGLTVWFSPHPGDLAGEDVVAYLAEAADVAERLRPSPESVVMVAGCELSLFCRGFFPGGTLDDRLAALADADSSPELQESFREVPRRLNAMLGEGVVAIRDRFRGPVTYASAPWETVDWTPFDLVSADLYRDRSNAAGYRELVRSYARFGKPVVVTEFGCCTYRGAADAGGLGFTVVDYDERSGTDRLTTAGLERSEAEQSRYLRELLAVFEDEAVDGAFWHTFAGWEYPHRADPADDLDLGSFGLVTVVEAPADGIPSREPKDAFFALADAYGRES